MKTILGKSVPYIIATVVAASIAVAVYASRGLTAESTQADRYRALCDTFTVPGVLLTAFGALLWVAGEGALIGVSWLVKYAVFALIPGKAADRVGYREYVEMHKDKPKHTHLYLFAVGGVFLAVAAVFLILFNNVS